MTESLLSPAVPAQREPELAREPDEAQDAARSRQVRLVVAAGVVVVAAAGWFFLHHNGAASTPAAAAGAPVVTQHHTSAGSGAATPPAVTTPQQIAAAFNGVVGRDPFKPLVQPAAAAPSAPAAAPSAPTSSSNMPAPAPATGTTATTSTAAAPAQPVWIELDSQNGLKSATFDVMGSDGKMAVYQNVAAPAQGKTTTFGQYFALISLQDGFAVVQMGDAKPFNVEQGYSNRHMLT